MKPQTFICLFLSLTVALQSISAPAMETDQYNLPPVPLADTGDEVSQYVEDNLLTAVAKVNAEIGLHEACLSAAKTIKRGCGNADEERSKLKYLRSNDTVATEVYKRLGDGSIFISYIGKWANTHKFHSSPSRYKTSYLDSIYVAQPVDYSTLSPTVRLFGTEFGTDKLDHFFQQGYKYYQIRRDAIAKGQKADEATTKAVKWGQMTERTYFGLLVSGVYSNADLYANYVGMKFYQGLTEPVPIGGKTRPALVTLKEGMWQLDKTRLHEDLLRPFVADQLNEALNPSGYGLLLYPSVRDIVRKKSCPKWKRDYPGLTAATVADKSKGLEAWNGEDYGYTKRPRTVRIAEACYSPEVRSAER
ncbi:MAG: hypothetical protein ABJB40_00905 [Acidobacteriota bacterium]